MLRSFHYATAHSLALGGHLRPEDVPVLRPWAALWLDEVARAFLGAYLRAAGSGVFLPSSREEIARLLQVHLLEKAAYEIQYELNNRPDWVRVPLSGLLQLLGEGPPHGRSLPAEG
jgi:maltose alpha-D-glucosyltransferase/alpha-amylase